MDNTYEIAKNREMINELKNRVALLERRMFNSNSIIERIAKIEEDVKWLKKTNSINTVVNTASWLTIISILIKLIVG